jgi:penicillin-binding protein 1A
LSQYGSRRDRAYPPISVGTPEVSEIAVSTNTLRQKSVSSVTQEPFVGSVLKVTSKTLLAFMLLTSATIAGGLVGLAISFRNLPDVRALRNYTPIQTTFIYDMGGEPLASLHGEANRQVVPLNRISPQLKRAVLAIEDSYFYYHPGVNPGGIARALLVNLASGHTREGGSTLTMQLVKNLFLSPDRTLSRKIAEAVLSLRVEQVFAKDEILELYLNQVYWGHNNYGVETAAQSYFGKSSEKLNLAEAAMMAGLVQAPEDYSPFVNPKLAKVRQETVLRRMRDLNWITPQEEQAALNQKLKYGKITSFQSSKSPYVTDAVVDEILRHPKLGEAILKRGGLRVQATVDSKLQKIAEETVKGWHDDLLYQVGADQMALVAVDPRTHFVKAVVGGVDYKKSQYNRATQALRQPGSAFKPFIYYTAFASGNYSPDSSINDSPVSYRDGSEYYEPKNYDNTFAGPMSLRAALAVSRNIPAIRLGQEVGLDKVIQVCRRLGITSPMLPVISLPLGSVDLTPLEMASAYATFASNGWHSPTTFIARITDTSGNVILDNTPKPKLILDPWAAASLTSTLQSVINEGTGTHAQIGRPAAGKTGTTNSQRDIWFVGYTPQLSAAVWVGNDNYDPLSQGATGGVFVAPVWGDFMRRALQNTSVEYFQPASDFIHP